LIRALSRAGGIAGIPCRTGGTVVFLLEGTVCAEAATMPVQIIAATSAAPTMRDFFVDIRDILKASPLFPLNIPAQRLSGYQCRSESSFSKISMTNGGLKSATPYAPTEGLKAQLVEPRCRSWGALGWLVLWCK